MGPVHLLQDDAKRPAGMQLGYGELALRKQMGWGDFKVVGLDSSNKGQEVLKRYYIYIIYEALRSKISHRAQQEKKNHLL